MLIVMKAVQPQGIADDRERLMAVVFLFSEYASKDRLDAKR